jgi:YfiH family protein
MLRQTNEEAEWLEFEQFAHIPGLSHAILLRGPAEAVIGCQTWSRAKQCHSARVVIASDQKEECDALVTQERGRGLVIQHADCQATIFYDPQKQVVANVHSGWRGNVQNIYASLVRFLQENFGCASANLLVGISPSLGPCCAEFRNFEVELPREFWPFQVRPTYFNLWEIARHQLMEAGILAHHIEIASICTCCSAGYHSYRRDKTQQRHTTVVVLNIP